MKTAGGKILAMTVRALAAGLTVGLWQAARPASAADFSGGRIVVIVKATTSQFWATVFDGADAAAKALGVQISKLGAAALAHPIEQATEAGIPVIVIDSDANTKKYVTFLATNNETGGQKAADELAACVKARTGKQEGNVAYL